MKVRQPLIDRLFDKVEFSEDGCWIFTGHVNNKGYPQINPGGRSSPVLAHRVVYEHVLGSIPSEFELDHICRVPRCVNPDHLEAVTHGENVRRAMRTSCKNGHRWTDETTMNYKNPTTGKSWRVCLACRAEYYERRGVTPLPRD